jgi:hypothetical protein
LIGAMAILLTAILPWFDLDAQCSMLDWSWVEVM